MDDTNVWYHGSPSGNLKGGISGLHLGTLKAATEALESRIGIPVNGTWDGTRKYGETLLCGSITLKNRNIFPTGFNCDVPKEDFYPNNSILPTYSDTSHMSLNDKPSMKKFRITCPMINTIRNPYSDNKANSIMKGLMKKGLGIRGIYYKNDGEDYGSISVVVPGNVVKEI